MKVELAGLVIEVRAPADLAPVVEPLFEACRLAPEAAAVELRVEALAAAEPVARPDARSLFYASQWHAHPTPDGWALYDGRSRIDVTGDGQQVTARLHPASLSDPDEVRVVGVMAAVLLALRVHGLYHVHGGCVRRADGTVVLVAGDSGHGKSTTTLTLMEPGAQVLGDDTLLLRQGEAGVEIHGFPRWFHVTDATWRAFPWLAAAEVAGRRTVLGKRCVDVSRLSRGGVAARVLWQAPAVLVLPRVEADEPTEWTRVEPGDAFGAMLVASAWVVVDGLPGREAHLELLGQLSSVGVAVDARMGRDALDASGVVPSQLRRVLAG